MGLLTEMDIKKIPSLYATEKETDPVAYVKFFTPDGSWSWYVLEYDRKERLCFGYVDGFEGELGYFSIEELEGWLLKYYMKVTVTESMMKP